MIVGATIVVCPPEGAALPPPQALNIATKEISKIAINLNFMAEIVSTIPQGITGQKAL